MKFDVDVTNIQTSSVWNIVYKTIINMVMVQITEVMSDILYGPT
jgi:hypothetical protein